MNTETKMSNASEDAMREAFEAWAFEHANGAQWIEGEFGGYYSPPYMSVAWAAWQAALSAPSVERSPRLYAAFSEDGQHIRFWTFDQARAERWQADTGGKFEALFSATNNARRLYAAPVAGSVAATWRDFPDGGVPEPDTECLVEVRYSFGDKLPFRSVDKWEMQREAPCLPFDSTTVETGYGWSQYDDAVLRWIPMSEFVVAPSAQGSGT